MKKEFVVSYFKADQYVKMLLSMQLIYSTMYNLIGFCDAAVVYLNDEEFVCHISLVASKLEVAPPMDRWIKDKHREWNLCQKPKNAR